ncbi:MAG: serine protein kinase PrkA [Thermodesulfobacteriota bacterium]|nr:serine protein kinase PrkA [Thermodesulfobacteriota bacterium]
MEKTEEALQFLNRCVGESDQIQPIPFEEFIKTLHEKPSTVIRNVFQVFHDMIKYYIDEGIDEYPDDPESVRFINYDCSRLFVYGSDRPFFADRLFANRLIKQAEAFKQGAQQNKIYIFEGPPGCGKSTFLDNLLMKFEEYANTREGSRFEVVWRLDSRLLGGSPRKEINPVLTRLCQLLDISPEDQNGLLQRQDIIDTNDNYIEVPCPSHDNPILMIPKNLRRVFFDTLFANDEFKWRLFTEKEYEWVFKSNPCTICSSLYLALHNALKTPQEVYKMIYAQPYRFNRRLGEGISVFNPGDKPIKQNILRNEVLQNRIQRLLKDGNQLKYIFSSYAKTNNGVYALMDIKSHNTERLIELHNIISEGLHKVEDVEENVDSLLIALMNPEDKKNIENFQSFSDRIEYIYLPYVLDLKTEVEIYRNTFGRHIDGCFLPRVLHNFARVIISTRLNIKSEALLEWIDTPSRYSLYCDENLQLLKMELYTGHIPTWLTEEDRKKLTAKLRRKIIAESEKEGDHGLSGRDSIRIFNDFYSRYVKDDKLISMSNLYDFFIRFDKEEKRTVPEGFLDSLCRMYNYTVLQEVKESLYYYNEEQISKDIKNYLFAINFKVGSVETCTFTKEKIDITEDFLNGIEDHLLGTDTDKEKRIKFREETQKEYASRTLTKEMMVEGKSIEDTEHYKMLHDQYEYHLKEKVLDPFLENENFRRAIKDYDSDDFKTYDKKIRNDVTFLMNNLSKKYNYTEKGAKEVCIYVIDNELAKNFAAR